MNKVDLAYYAGIFDGEGCISIGKAIKKKYHKDGTERECVTYGLRIEVVNTNEWLCRQLWFAFGGYVRQMKEPEINRQAVWVWQTQCKHASEVLQTLLPYLKLKRPQAEIAIAFQGRVHQHGKRALTEEERALREAQKIMISNMNRPIRKG